MQRRGEQSCVGGKWELDDIVRSVGFQPWDRYRKLRNKMIIIGCLKRSTGFRPLLESKEISDLVSTIDQQIKKIKEIRISTGESEQKMDLSKQEQKSEGGEELELEKNGLQMKMEKLEKALNKALSDLGEMRVA